IVGVAPAGYDGAPFAYSWHSLARRDAWIPPHIVPVRDLFGRLAPGATIEQADAEVATRSLPRGEGQTSRVLGVHRGIGPELGDLHFSDRAYFMILLLL